MDGAGVFTSCVKTMCVRLINSEERRVPVAPNSEIWAGVVSVPADASYVRLSDRVVRRGALTVYIADRDGAMAGIINIVRAAPDGVAAYSRLISGVDVDVRWPAGGVLEIAHAVAVGEPKKYEYLIAGVYD